MILILQDFKGVGVSLNAIHTIAPNFDKGSTMIRFGSKISPKCHIEIFQDRIHSNWMEILCDDMWKHLLTYVCFPLKILAEVMQMAAKTFFKDFHVKKWFPQLMHTKCGWS